MASLKASFKKRGDSLCDYALKFFNPRILLEGSNDTLLVLIPKVNNLLGYPTSVVEGVGDEFISVREILIP